MNISKSNKLEGKEVTHIECNKNKSKFKGSNLDTIIIHYTGGASGKSSAKYLAKNSVKASAHIVVDRDGSVIQLVDFDTIAWHAGESSYGDRTYLNRYSIGIELDNFGPLTKTQTGFQSYTKRTIPDNEVFEGNHPGKRQDRYWHDYTAKQLEVCNEICELLIEKYDITKILGHEEISPGRKIDPGPAFPMRNFRTKLLNESRGDEDSELQNEKVFASINGTVNASSLNIRAGAGPDYNKVAKPLVKGKKVDIINEKNGWYKVSTTIEGWVSKEYIDEKN
jgi:N-acetylmuramoyl-L-alanine amidase